MNMVHRIHRRLKVNRAVRELSRLDNGTLLDIGIERGNITELVESMIDSNSRIAAKAVHENVIHNYPVHGGAVA